MIGRSVVLAIAFALPGDLYTVVREAGTILLSADRSAVSCEQALVELGEAVGWRIVFQTAALKRQFGSEVVDLSFTRQGARTVAKLLAAAGGADVEFVENRVHGQRVLDAVVVPPPDPSVPEGRQRLQKRAIDWYRTFLDERLPESVSSDELADVRMRLARLLEDRGALREAAHVFLTVYEDDRAGAHVPKALLAVAECFYELGGEHLRDAEHWARELAAMPPDFEETGSAIVLLGKVLNATGRYRDCVKTLTRAFVRLVGSPEIVDLRLTVADAHFHLGEASEVLDVLLELESDSRLDALTDGQTLDYLFLRGYGLSGTDELAGAAEAIGLFLGAAPEDDPRRRVAWIILGDAFLGQGRYVEAYAAALRARDRDDPLAAPWEQAFGALFSATVLRVGDRERALEELEELAQRVGADNPGLVLEVADALAQALRFQKAVQLLETLIESDGEWSERARVALVRAIARRAEQSQSLESFSTRAIQVAVGVEDEALRLELAEIFGRTYERLGELEKAEEAYRGILR